MNARALLLLLTLRTARAQTRTVRPGDTFGSIARTARTTPDTRLTLNALPTTLQVGQVLKLPQTGYTVQPGDTLCSIARRHGTAPDALAAANQLPSSTVQVGQVLRLSGDAGPAVSFPATPPVPASARPAASRTLERGLFTPPRLPTSTPTTFRTASTGLSRPASAYLPDVGFASQTRNNCGPASVAAAVQHYGVQATQSTWQDELRPDGKNMHLPTAQKLLQGLGFTAPALRGGTIEDIKRLVAQGSPVIVLQYHSVLGKVPHFRVVRGYDDAQSYLIMSDSLSGPNVALTGHDFDLLWNTQGRQDLSVRSG